MDLPSRSKRDTTSRGERRVILLQNRPRGLPGHIPIIPLGFLRPSVL